MNTLFTFGCSYTADFETNNIENYLKYKEYRGGSYPKSWPTLLSEKMGMNVKNYGIGGTGNQSIFEQFCIHCDEINENDVVIIEWSFIHRYRMVIDNGSRHSWYNITTGRPTLEIFDKSKSTFEIFDKIHNTIIENRTSDLYVDEIFNYIKLINEFSKSKKFKIFYWFADEGMKKRLSRDTIDIENFICWEKSIKEETYLQGGITIKEETNNVVNDDHFGESGHQIQSNIIYKHIQKQMI